MFCVQTSAGTSSEQGIPSGLKLTSQMPAPSQASGLSHSVSAWLPQALPYARGDH